MRDRPRNFEDMASAGMYFCNILQLFPEDGKAGEKGQKSRARVEAACPAHALSVAFVPRGVHPAEMRSPIAKSGSESTPISDEEMLEEVNTANGLTNLDVELSMDVHTPCRWSADR